MSTNKFQLTQSQATIHYDFSMKTGDPKIFDLDASKVRFSEFKNGF